MLVHFGFGVDTKLEALQILWPDGAVSTIEQLTPATLVRATRSKD